MDLTPQDLWTLRNIIIRAVNESHEVLAAAARRAGATCAGSGAHCTTPAPRSRPHTEAHLLHQGRSRRPRDFSGYAVQAD